MNAKTSANNCIIILKPTPMAQSDSPMNQSSKQLTKANISAQSMNVVKQIKEAIVLKSATSTSLIPSAVTTNIAGKQLAKSPSISSSSSAASSDEHGKLVKTRPPPALNICPSIIVNGQIVAKTVSNSAPVDKRLRQFSPPQEEESELNRVFRVCHFCFAFFFFVYFCLFYFLLIKF